MNKKNKVLLFFPIINENTRYHWFPFSAMTLGASLRKHGFEPIIIDERITPDYQSVLEEHLNDSLCFGTSAMTGYQIAGSLRAASTLRKLSPATPIIWGGRHATLLPDETLKDDFVDIVVMGQGEVTLVQLAKAFACGSSLESIKGICYKLDGGIRCNESQPVVDARMLNGFDFELINVEDYINPETRAFAYFSSYGCPGKCGFCTNSWLRQKWFSYDTMKVLDDIEYLSRKYNLRNLMFQDSNFFVDRKRVAMLVDGFIKRDLNLRWKASIRADTFWKYDDDLLDLIEESGLESLFIGFESGSQRMLDIMSKGTKTEDAIKTVRKAARYNFGIHGSLMFAVPHETVDDLKLTIDHMRELQDLNSNIKFQTCFYSPFPQTTLYKMALDLGYKPPTGLRGWQEISEQTKFYLPVWFSDRVMRDEYERTFNDVFSVANAVTTFNS